MKNLYIITTFQPVWEFPKTKQEEIFFFGHVSGHNRMGIGKV